MGNPFSFSKLAKKMKVVISPAYHKWQAMDVSRGYALAAGLVLQTGQTLFLKAASQYFKALLEKGQILAIRRQEWVLSNDISLLGLNWA